MGENTKIEWTDATWNPVRGCSAISPGCANCYAANIAARFKGAGQPFEALAVRHEGQPAKWTGEIRMVPEKLADPLRWKRPRMVFVDSMSDLFHEAVPFEFIDKVFAIMALCKQHTFQVLTKRAARMAEYFQQPRAWHESQIYQRGREIAQSRAGGKKVVYGPAVGLPLPNVWLGTSVEKQAAADERIPHLLRCPAAVRFLSMEPLLGPVELERIEGTIGVGLHSYDVLRGRNYHWDDGGKWTRSDKIDWVIAGGESGPGARPMHPDWVRSIRDQCGSSGVPFFFKQWGEWVPTPFIDSKVRSSDVVCIRRDGSPGDSYRDGVRLIRVGKKAAGRLLDGRTWDQLPEVRA